jgi:hypothetical protein
MAAAAPLPKKPEAKVEDELDTALDRIEQCLPAIHERVAASKRAGQRSPSDSFNPSRIVRTQQVFQQMADEPLLSESGEDIVLDD